MPDALDWTPERRRALRVDVPVSPGAAAVTHAGAMAGAVAGAMALRQVSAGGILIEGPEPMLPGSTCDVTLAVAGHQPLTVQGRVVYSRTAAPFGDGVIRYTTALALEAVDGPQLQALRAIVVSVGHAAGPQDAEAASTSMDEARERNE